MSYFFLSKVINKHIRFPFDGTTVVYYTNNFRGVKSIKYHSITKDIWLWVLNTNNHLLVEHLTGNKNMVTEGASFVFDGNADSSLSSNVFVQIENEIVQFSINLFASRLNTKHFCGRRIRTVELRVTLSNHRVCKQMVTEPTHIDV